MNRKFKLKKNQAYCVIQVHTYNYETTFKKWVNSLNYHRKTPVLFSSIYFPVF